MKLSEFLIHHARGQGKTHNLAKLCQAVKGTLIVRNLAEANRLQKEYGVEAIPYDTDPDRLRGRHFGITYVDPDAAGLWVSSLECENERLRKKNSELTKKAWKYDQLNK